MPQPYWWISCCPRRDKNWPSGKNVGLPSKNLPPAVPMMLAIATHLSPMPRNGVAGTKSWCSSQRYWDVSVYGSSKFQVQSARLVHPEPRRIFGERQERSFTLFRTSVEPNLEQQLLTIDTERRLIR